MLRNTYKLLLLIVILIPLVSFAGPASGGHGRAVLGINIANGQVDSGPVEGVTILGVTPGGGADAAGLAVNDVLISIDQQSLTADAEREANGRLLRFMADVVPGQTVQLTYLRDGDVLEAALTVGELDPGMLPPGFPFRRDIERLGRHLERNFTEPLQFRWRHHGTFGGMELVSLSPGLGRYFGTDEGLLVVRAPDNEEIGLEDGDVIRMIGTRKPNDPGHAMRILRSYEPGEELVIQILRETESREVRLTLPKPPERTGSFFSTPERWNPGNWLRSPGRI